MPKLSSSKLMIWTLFASYLLFGFGGAVIAACCPDAPVGYQARRVIGCQDETYSSVGVLHQGATVPVPKETCLNHCNPARHSRHLLFSGQTANHVGELHGDVIADSTSFTQHPPSADFSAYSSRVNVPQLALVVLRTVVLLV